MNPDEVLLNILKARDKDTPKPQANTPDPIEALYIESSTITLQEFRRKIEALVIEAVERHVRIVQGCISEACSTDDDTDIDDVNEIIEYVRDNPNNYIESNGGIQLNKELL